ncbi:MULTISPECIES: dienelactone hydrolase family protein [unclassified Xanthobacter]|uniref:dienelactone hydrolase family protein n=1 Tax=unclassified Xanthobacter TaxID=2623496 RepID=UPI001EDD32EC|nr:MULTISPECIES: alpha/beta hydrolase [unclassified Xanthobacter]
MGVMPQEFNTSREVQIPPFGLAGEVVVPAGARRLVVFVHDAASDHTSVRNRTVARLLQPRGFATVVFDLVRPQDRADGARVVDDLIEQSDRLVELLSWIGRERDLASLPCSLFGAGTGAAVALVAAARVQSRVHALVSRGGRPDLAKPVLGLVRAPTLLLVGSADLEVLDQNRSVMALFGGPAALEVVPGASHLFAEEGALEAVARLTADWLAAQVGLASSGQR